MSIRQRKQQRQRKLGKKIIGLDDFTVEKLKEWLHIRNTWIVGIKKRSDFLFINPFGDLVKMPNYAGALKTLCSRNKLTHSTLICSDTPMRQLCGNPVFLI
ncbi:MAG TPA: hypothetical protein DEO65_16165 [Bacillus bacterium]|nr:hypothetical protein [Bacillus sp. (in: firmicutes)]